MLWYAKEAELPVEGVKSLNALSLQKRLRKKTRPSPSVGVVKSDNSLTNLTTFRLRRVASYLRAVPVNLRHQYLLKLMFPPAHPARIQSCQPVSSRNMEQWSLPWRFHHPGHCSAPSICATSRLFISPSTSLPPVATKLQTFVGFWLVVFFNFGGVLGFWVWLLL
ncbi:hypothetical protein BCR33DRAFT_288482 [Rhizoclosmatium globosum]|uniref:Uncharacterized protein n=1 Tax=Rhizoclosmatium globosum TaxID=329046 RepID=A0A1Y2C7A4_9FUNG|nr:hypothetical protein BCR33DRAFT_288482 [Rhizoclosmatium globosum]|eukprot:ORY42912.1 hypothetical protein BCR33DRAFT_288482 [Rhizoclosmatium globosum]